MAHYKGAATESNRAMQILKRREKAREELELKKRRIEEDLNLSTIDNRFATHDDPIEVQLRTSTVGLVTLDQMRQKQEHAERERLKQAAQPIDNFASKSELKGCGLQGTSKKGLPKTLSFGYDESDDDDSDDEDGDEERNGQKRTDISKDDEQKRCDIEDGQTTSEFQKSTQRAGKATPSDKKKQDLSRSALNVDTTFLPDRQREEEERLLREKLAAEWRERQQKLKEETIDVTFSYWDGSGHRRVVRMKKGNTIYQFLQATLETLRKDFTDLRNVTADQLMYVKEDLIIPHHYSFYDFIVTKARGKSGPLFSFDVHDDVRLIADASVEKDESHAGKVLLRSWYERNKHIFPASRWEPYDPTKTYEKYTINDKRHRYE